MSHELAVQDLGMPTGIGLRDPEVILEEAGERARALTAMVELTKAFTQIGPSKHLRVEAWITVGQFYGCSARTTQTEEVSYNGVFGFKAHARVTHDATGQILTEAEALCMQDEKNWDSKPLHQLMSMAQTRAVSKALAMKFRWVVTLGGFAPTPAEEMSGDEHATHKPTTTLAKAPPAPSFAYGKFKGKQVNDPEIPIDYLEFMADSTAKSLDDPAKAKFKAQNQLFLAALDAEIASRQGKPGPGEAQSEKQGEAKAPMQDAAWDEFIALATKDYANELDATVNEFKSEPIHLSTADRWAFFDRVNKLVGARA